MLCMCTLTWVITVLQHTLTLSLTACHADRFPIRTVIGRFISTGAHLAVCYTWLGAIASHISEEKRQSIIIWSNVQKWFRNLDLKGGDFQNQENSWTAKGEERRTTEWWLYDGSYQPSVKINCVENSLICRFWTYVTQNVWAFIAKMYMYINCKVNYLSDSIRVVYSFAAFGSSWAPVKTNIIVQYGWCMIA